MALYSSVTEKLGCQCGNIVTKLDIGTLGSFKSYYNEQNLFFQIFLKQIQIDFSKYTFESK